MKKCYGCKEHKNLEEFGFQNKEKNLRRSECKLCRKISTKIYRDNPKSKKLAKEYKDIWYQKNRIRIREKALINYQINIEHHRKKDRDRMPTKVAQRKERYQNDPLYKAQMLLRCGISRAFKIKKWSKNSYSEKLLGCNFDTALKHIERQFKKGMAWGNMGEWEIDHIIPISIAKNLEETKTLCHYTNLQPLWKLDNRKKSNKILQVQIKLTL